jgi:hypothetical protein
MLREKFDTYRFEGLLFALLMVIFNKIFFEAAFYSSCVWEGNMVLLGIASLGIFREQKLFWRIVKNTLFLLVIIVPIFSTEIFSSYSLTLSALIAYVLFYVLIFTEVLRQITQKAEVTLSIILGSLCGFLLLVIISVFGFLLQNHFEPDSFNGIKGDSVSETYHQFAYFGIITLTTIGFGDITPATDNARLLTAFWGVVGQFYMVGIVGIIISKFTSK